MKLSLSILLLAVPIFVISVSVLFTQSRNSVRQEAMERANSVLNTTMHRMSRHINAVITATNTMEWLVVRYFQPDSLLAFSYRIVQLNPHIDGCSISAEPDMFPEYGHYFSAYTIREGDSIVTAVEEPYEYFKKPWYRLPQEQGKPCWVDFYDETDSLDVAMEGMIASYGKALYSDSGQLLGTISTDISLRDLSEIINAEHPYPHSFFLMVGEEGRYSIHPDTAQLFTAVDTLTAFGRKMMAGEEGNMQASFNGEPCLVCFKPVPGTSWNLALICPEKDILKSYHQLTYIIAPLLFFGLFLILLLCYRVVSYTVKPINQLLDKTQSIAEGNYEVYIPRSIRKDAVGRLQNSFATMLQSLNFHMGSIRYAADQTKLRNEELEKATLLVKESDRQKTDFIQNVTHQIRTPLNIIMGFAQVLRDSGGQLPQEEAKSIAETMAHNSMSLNRMLLMLFDCSDMGLSKELADRENYEPVPCNKLARECVEYTSKIFQGMPITFQTDVPDSLCIPANHLYLMRSLRELLYNSAKYSDRQHISLHISETPQSVRFVFQDTGPGIAPEHREAMYNTFTKVNALSEGLGLGLALAKRHVSNQGGELTLDEDYHDGCRFIIMMPKAR